MKKIVGFLMVALLALMALPMSAQLKFGIRGDVSTSSVHFNSDILKADNVISFQVGPMIKTTLPLVGVGIDATVLYSQKNLEMTSVSGIRTSMKTDCIDAPINLKWKFGLPTVRAYLTVGPYTGFRIGGDEFQGIPGSVADQARAKDFSTGLNFSTGVELISHLQMGFSYGPGLTDNYSIEKVNLSDGAGKNRGRSIMTAILF